MTVSRDDVSRRLKVQDARTLELKGGLSITFAAASQGGYYPGDIEKANQDAFIAGSRICGTTSLLFAVLDGHGHNGAECAMYARDQLLKECEGWMVDDLTHGVSILDKSQHHSFHKISSSLETGKAGVDTSYSGTTATVLIVTDANMHTAHVGDSRCLLIEQDKVTSLTMDHVPDREDEVKRIESHGGVVMISEQYDTKDLTLPGQKRIWSNEGKWPGTAFTRSLGDAVAKQLGVCADPECAHFPIHSDSIFVLGSDGVFDFISNEQIGEIVKKFNDPDDACRELVGTSWYKWCDSEERTDDITVIVGRVKRSAAALLSADSAGPQGP